MGSKLSRFVADMTQLADGPAQDEARLLERAGLLMAELVASDDWLPDVSAQAHPQHYQQHLLYVDPQDRFSIVSFVWGPGQRTPIHDHTVWGVIAMLRGAECAQRYAFAADGRPTPSGTEERLEAGQIDKVSPTIGDVHVVRNAFDDQVSISIHLYGGNIGKIRRHVFAPDTGVAKEFISGYSGCPMPQLGLS